MNIPSNCYSYEEVQFNNKDEFNCTSCYPYYTLDTTNNKCISCPNQCTSCYYENNRLYCTNCALNYVLNEDKYCEYCTNNAEIGGEGCIQCIYSNGVNKCTGCRYDYIHIDNDYVCKLPSEVNLNVTCQNATRLPNGEHSCVKCRKGNYTLMTRFNNTNDCYESKNEIMNCEIGNEDEDKNLTCTKCRYNYQFIWSLEYQQNVCDDKCAFDSFFNDNPNIKGCYKCDNVNGRGQIGCNPLKGCSYRYTDDHFYCNSCKSGYFLYDDQCLPCSARDGNCTECDFNNTENKFICNKCKDNSFFINETTFLCDLITYDEYPEVTVGCILPNNNYSIYIKNNKCYGCKYGFFKTKEESCIYCKARKNGGPKCDECQYITNEAGIEINRIINCKICQIGNMLSPIGKRCYNCEDEVGPGCARCEFEDITERVICVECKPNYYLNESGNCIFKNSNEDNDYKCLAHEQSNSNRILRDGLKCIK